ncbi:MAG: sensor histidine kinase [Actinomycetales bacterium]
MSESTEPHPAPASNGRVAALIRRGRPATLAGRLALGGVAWIAAWGLALLVIFNLVLSVVMEDQIDAALRARAEAVLITVAAGDGQVLAPSPESDDEALDAGTSIYEGDRLVAGVDLSPGLRHLLLQRGEVSADRDATAVRYLALPIEAGGGQVGTVVVSSDIGALSTSTRIVGLASLVLIALMLAITFFALRSTVGRALRPVRSMGEQASAWSDEDLDGRFDPQGSPRELRELAVTLNGLLERIAAALRHERALTAELSHELRTPLAHLHAEVNLMAEALNDPARPEQVTATDLDQLLGSVRRLESLVETALAPARAEQVIGLGRVEEVLDGLRAPAGHPARVEVEGDLQAILAVDSDVARRALTPLLENAFRYARNRVHVQVRAGQPARDGSRADLVAFVVADDGGKLDPDLTEQIFVPGFRADGADGHAGAGLGLALSRRIARAAGGDVVAEAATGRTLVTLTLPGVSR